MTAALSTWVRTLAAGSLFCGVILLLLPECGEKRAVRLGCGLVLILLLIEPLRSLDAERMAEFLSAQRVRETGLAEAADEVSMELCRKLIREMTEEYIWDAASRLGIARLGIRLRLHDGEPVPYPWSVDLTGEYTLSQQEALSLLLEGELGIPRERQTWSMSDAG